MKPEVEALMLAGGRGFRMGQLTEDTQKCLLQIEGRPIIGHIMERLISAFGSVDLKVAISYKGEDVKEYINRNKPPKVSVTYIPVPKGLDDYGAYENAEEFINGVFLAIPGDIIIKPQAYVQVMELFLNSGADVATVLSPLLDVADTHPVAKLKGSEVVEYFPKAPSQFNSDYLRDLMIFATSEKLFHYIKLYPSSEGYLGNVIQQIVSRHHSLNATTYSLAWQHIGYPEDLLKSFPL
jgi:NDP-sugar pyrophosphorylase family protein